jgi:hypothetical protein
MSDKLQYWRISPGQEGFLWREQKLNGCIAIGWSKIGDAKKIKSVERALRDEYSYTKRSADYAAGQIDDFVNQVQVGDRVIASSSGKGIYAVGTIIGNYVFNDELEYKHSRKVRWETTFWSPVEIESLRLSKTLRNKFHGQSSKTIRRLESDEWNLLSRQLNQFETPFRNLPMWGGLVQAPEYENEVMILFSHMLQHFGMRIIQFGTRFPDAIVERKRGRRWEKINVEFELHSSGFKNHLNDPKCIKNSCVIVCWENDHWGKKEKLKKDYKIIELKKVLQKIL